MGIPEKPVPEPVAPVTLVTNPPAPPTAEPGQATTEFFATQGAALVMQVIALLALFHVLPGLPAGGETLVFGISQSTVGLVEAGYAISRGVRKSGTQG